jgi:hypothetical protein
MWFPEKRFLGIYANLVDQNPHSARVCLMAKIQDIMRQVKDQKSPGYAGRLQQVLRASPLYHVEWDNTELTVKNVPDDWPIMHRWCGVYFGERYNWTGNIFWFENAEDAHIFKIKWLWGIDEFLTRFPFAIRTISNDTHNADHTASYALYSSLKRQFGARLHESSLYYGRWVGLPTEQDAMYARLLLPGNEFVKATDVATLLARPLLALAPSE